MASISKTVRPKRSNNSTVSPVGFGLTVGRGTPSVSSGGASYFNEPAGLSTPWTITATQPNPFDVRPTASADAYGWRFEEGDYSRMTIAVDAERGNVLKAQILTGDPGGAAAFTAVAGGQSISGGSAPFVARKLFLGFHVKLSPNWTDANEATKLVMLWGTTPSHSNNPIYLSRQAVPYLTSSFAIQNGVDATSQTWSTAGYSRDVWHKMEYYVEQNTPGVNNGIFRSWVDGVVVQNLANVRWVGAGDPAGNYNWLKFNLVYGGGLTPAPNDMYALFDDWYVKVGP